MPSASNNTDFWKSLAMRLHQRAEVPEALRRLVAGVAEMNDTTLSHDACQAQLYQYVQDELAGKDVARVYPEVYTHLQQCAICEPVYAEFLTVEADLAELDRVPAEGFAPPDLSFLPPLSLRAFVQEVAETVVGQAFSAFRTELEGTITTFFRDIEVYGDASILDPSGALQDEPADTFSLVSTTYAATVYLFQQSASLPLTQPDVLRPLVHAQAVNVARRQGLRARDAERFADVYTELVIAQPQLLLHLRRD